jgi:hypothetical protein
VEVGSTFEDCCGWLFSFSARPSTCPTATGSPLAGNRCQVLQFQFMDSLAQPAQLKKSLA